ncbi:hypothetical protein GH140_01590 [bacterium]|nr:hypothetical protein [bacterium]
MKKRRITRRKFIKNGLIWTAGTATSLGSFQNAVANEKNRYYLEQVVKFRTFYKKPPIREGYEVVIRDLK